MGYAEHLNPSVPQTEALPGQVANSGGGFSFGASKWTRLDRFLVLGSDGGSYCASERTLTIENAKCVEECLAENGARVVAAVVAVSEAGRAPKNDPALVALAIAMKKGDAATRAVAVTALPLVARTGTHLFHLAEYVKQLGGWGRGTKRAFAQWYAEKTPERLALQGIKYQQRDGWSHADILRKAHLRPAGDASRDGVIDWMVHGWPDVGAEPHADAALVKVWAFERAKRTSDPKELVRLIREYGLPHECVPNEAKGNSAVWQAILETGMGLTALVRNLGKMTSVGLLAPLSAHVRLACDRLGDVDQLRAARMHPLSLLVALRTYAQGHGDKGSLSWQPVPQIIDALDAAFYAAFKSVEPTGKRHLLALDVSGSMSSQLANMPISCCEGTAAMSLVTANVEPEFHAMAFCHAFVPLAISPRMRLDTAMQETQKHNFGSTDCALPMLWALKNKIDVDVFCVYTDSETNSSSMHPKQAIERYRQKTGIPAKLVVVGMVANRFTVADPDDAGMLDVCGFDAASPGVIAEFARP